MESDERSGGERSVAVDVSDGMIVGEGDVNVTLGEGKQVQCKGFVQVL